MMKRRARMTRSTRQRLVGTLCVALAGAASVPVAPASSAPASPDVPSQTSASPASGSRAHADSTAWADVPEALETEYRALEAAVERFELDEAIDGLDALLPRIEAATGDDSPATASVIDLLVLAHIRTRNPTAETLEPLADRAVVIREAHEADQPVALAHSLVNRATLHRVAAEYDRAIDLAERAVALRERELGPDALETAKALSFLNYVLRDSGQTARALAVAERVLDIRRRVLGPEHTKVASALNQIGSTLVFAGRYVEARDALARSLAIQEKTRGPEHLTTVSAMHNLAVIQQRLGYHAEARVFLERALVVRRARLAPDHPTLAQNLKVLGDVLAATGDHQGAIDYLEEALTIRERVLGADHAYVAAVADALGAACIHLGRYDDAERYLQRALSIYRANASLGELSVASTLNNLAIVEAERGRPAAAESIHRDVLSLREAHLDARHPDVLTSRHNLASELRWGGRPTEALALIEAAVEGREEVLGSDHPDLASSLVMRAMVLADLGDPGLAMTSAARANGINRRQLRETMSVLSERQALESAARLRMSLDWLLSVAVDHGEEKELVSRALDELIRSRALVLDEMGRRRRLGVTSSDPVVLELAAELGAARDTLAELLVLGPAGEPEAYRARLERARARLERAEFAQGEATRRVASRGVDAGIAEVRAALPDRSAIVAYARYWHQQSPRPDPFASRSGDGRYLAFVLRDDRVDVPVVPLGSAAKIDSLVASWRREVTGIASTGDRTRGIRRDRVDPDVLDRYRRAGDALRSRIWDPVASVVDDRSLALIVPAGALNLVSFASLPSGADSYLVEAAPTLHVLSSERLVAASQGDRHGRGLLALGGVAFDASPASGDEPLVAGRLPPEVVDYRGFTADCLDFGELVFEPLPLTAEEVTEVATVFRHGRRHGGASPADRAATEGDDGRTRVLLGSEATEAALRSLAPAREVVHVATHGFFVDPTCGWALAASGESTRMDGAKRSVTVDASALRLSGLALAGANRRAEERSSQYDGVLTAEEIVGLDLEGVGWVVLSACNTGVGRVSSSEGVFGLRRAVEIAGARTLIMSLWPVSDEATRDWMSALYAARFRDGLSTAEACRAACLVRLAALREAGYSTHPHRWAGCVAAGDWR